MATLSGTQAALGGLPADVKKALTGLMEYLLKNWRLGRPGDQVASENFRGVFLEAVTSSVANREFSIEHGLESAPYLLIPILALQDVNCETVDLKVTRAADARRVYLSSSVTGAPIRIFVEG